MTTNLSHHDSSRLAENFRRAREANDISLPVMAEFLGMNKGSLSKFETNKQKRTKVPPWLHKAANKLGVGTDWLLRGSSAAPIEFSKKEEWLPERLSPEDVRRGVSKQVAAVEELTAALTSATASAPNKPVTASGDIRWRKPDVSDINKIVEAAATLLEKTRPLFRLARLELIRPVISGIVELFNRIPNAEWEHRGARETLFSAWYQTDHIHRYIFINPLGNPASAQMALLAGDDKTLRHRYLSSHGDHFKIGATFNPALNRPGLDIFKEMWEQPVPARDYAFSRSFKRVSAALSNRQGFERDVGIAKAAEEHGDKSIIVHWAESDSISYAVAFRRCRDVQERGRLEDRALCLMHKALSLPVDSIEFALRVMKLPIELALQGITQHLEAPAGETIKELAREVRLLASLAGSVRIAAQMVPIITGETVIPEMKRAGALRR